MPDDSSPLWGEGPVTPRGSGHFNSLINEGIELLSEDLRKDTLQVIDAITKHGPDICRPLCQVLANQAAMMSAIALLLNKARD